MLGAALKKCLAKVDDYIARVVKQPEPTFNAVSERYDPPFPGIVFWIEFAVYVVVFVVLVVRVVVAALT